MNRFMLLAAASCALAACAKPEDAPALSAATQYQWTLIEARDQQKKRLDALFDHPDGPLVMRFSDKMVSFDHTCNHMSGAYKITDNQLRIEPLYSTMMACIDPALEALDREVGKQLSGDHQARIETEDAHAVLTLKQSGVLLKWRGQMTPEALYGEGETLFLRVAAEKKACSVGAGKSECLQVKKVIYENGLKSGEDADWSLFYAPINGFEHRDGVQEIIRVKRYTRENPPADVSKYVYVYDMTVESASH